MKHTLWLHNTSVCDTHIFDMYITYCRRVLQSKENGMFYHKLKPDEIWKPPKEMSNKEAEKISKCDFFVELFIAFTIYLELESNCVPRVFLVYR